MTEPVTRKNYIERALAFCRAQGLRSGDYPVIQKTEIKQWNAWRRYFIEHLGMAWVGSAMSARASWTVPADYPWNFDLAYAPPAHDNGWYSEPESAEYRANVVERVLHPGIWTTDNQPRRVNRERAAAEAWCRDNAI